MYVASFAVACEAKRASAVPTVKQRANAEHGAKKSGSPCGEPNRTNNHGVPVKGLAYRAIAVPLDEDECATGIALAR
jgi:hypothetical protein